MISLREFAGGVRDSEHGIHLAIDDVRAGASYETFVRHRGSRRRLIHRPSPGLMFLLKKAAEYIVTISPAPADHVFGFIAGRSIRENASRHLDKDVVLRLDLEDFFGSIVTRQVGEALQELDFEPEAAALVAELLTIQGILPTGFPTSPAVSNLVFAPTDVKLAAWSAREGVQFTRYVDDLVFSGAVGPSAPAELGAILTADGWTVNDTKSLVMKRGGKQYVTGLSVSDATAPRLPVRWKRQLRFKLHIIEKFGYDAYWHEFGGEDLNDYPRRLIGMARHAAGVEPHFGGEILRKMDAALADANFERTDADWGEWIDEILGRR